MKQWTKKAAVALMAGCVAATGITGCSSKTVDNSETVVTVNGEAVSYGVANFTARMNQATYEYYYESLMGTTIGAELWQTEVEEGVTYEDSMKDTILTTIENLYIIRQHAEEYGVVLTEEDEAAIDDAVAIFMEDNALEDKELVSAEEEYVKEYLELMTIQAKMDEPMKEGIDEEVSDEEAAQKAMSYVYFEFETTDEDGNTVELTDDEKAALKADAEALSAALNGDPTLSIDTLAAEYETEATAVTFDSESTSPDSTLIAAVDALTTVGTATDVIETDYGYYVAQLTSLLDEEATEAEKQSILEERKSEKYTEVLESWMAEAEITLNEDVWEKLDFETVGVTYKDSSAEYDDTTE